jgi:hypothetical protein
MPNCLLQGYGECRGKLSGEHFISEVVLKQVAVGKSVTIGGLPWQPPGTLEPVGIGSLQCKIFCEGHNNSFSCLDTTGGLFIETIDAIDKNPAELPAVTQVDGDRLERWLLKMIIGIAGGQGMADGIVHDDWKRVVTGGAWPEGWGLYACERVSPTIFVKDVHLETWLHPETKRILNVDFYLAGVNVRLALGRPDDPSALGVYRPSGLVFHLPEGERRVEFRWSSSSNTAITYTKVGTTTDGPCHRIGWSQGAGPTRR